MSLKRPLSDDDVVSNKQLKQLQKKFDQNPQNVIIRNALTVVGLMGACTDMEKANKVDHIFSHSIKAEHTRCTDQEQSGRCWMFSGANSLRHFVIKALNLKNFEFSATYLFFYDKFERANYFLNESLDHLATPLNDQYWSARLKDPQEDGGHFYFFVNLVNKYGLVPHGVMPETYHSSMSIELNHSLNKILRAGYWYFRQNKNNMEKIKAKKEEIMEQVYSLLVKYLGAPPKTFSWSYQASTEDGTVPGRIENCSPMMFKQIGTLGLDMNDFICLGNFPTKTYNKLYLRQSNNVTGAPPGLFLNLPMRDVKKYTLQSILSGISTWFSADVRQGHHQYKFSFDDTLVNTDLIFGETMKLNKADRLAYGESSACHAMNLVGVNIDAEGLPTRWQVENSWGYLDPETVGFDGFYSMSDQWFEDHVFEVVVHKQFLSKKALKLLSSTPIVLDYFDPAG